MAKFITVEGIESRITEELTLESVHRLLGGYAAVVTIPGDHLMVCDEEGMCKGLPVNALASSIAGRTTVGPVIICSKKEFPARRHR
jgi:hypothetical protein